MSSDNLLDVGNRVVFNYINAKILLEDLKGVEIVGEGREIVETENCKSSGDEFDVVQLEDKDEDGKEHNKKNVDNVYDDEIHDTPFEGAPKLSSEKYKPVDDLQHQNLT